LPEDTRGSPLRELSSIQRGRPPRTPPAFGRGSLSPHAPIQWEEPCRRNPKHNRPAGITGRAVFKRFGRHPGGVLVHCDSAPGPGRPASAHCRRRSPHVNRGSWRPWLASPCWNGDNAIGDEASADPWLDAGPFHAGSEFHAVTLLDIDRTKAQMLGICRRPKPVVCRPPGLYRLGLPSNDFNLRGPDLPCDLLRPMQPFRRRRGPDCF